MIKLIKKFFKEEFDLGQLRIILIIIALITLISESFSCGLIAGIFYFVIQFRIWLENEIEKKS